VNSGAARLIARVLGVESLFTLSSSALLALQRDLALSTKEMRVSRAKSALDESVNKSSTPSTRAIRRAAPEFTVALRNPRNRWFGRGGAGGNGTTAGGREGSTMVNVLPLRAGSSDR